MVLLVVLEDFIGNLAVENLVIVFEIWRDVKTLERLFAKKRHVNTLRVYRRAGERPGSRSWRIANQFCSLRTVDTLLSGTLPNTCNTRYPLRTRTMSRLLFDTGQSARRRLTRRHRTHRTRSPWAWNFWHRFAKHFESHDKARFNGARGSAHSHLASRCRKPARRHNVANTRLSFKTRETNNDRATMLNFVRNY